MDRTIATTVVANSVEYDNLRRLHTIVRTLDNSESIASTLARFVRFERRYDTINRLFQLADRCTPEDLLAVVLFPAMAFGQAGTNRL